MPADQSGSPYKITGYCTCCPEPCLEIIQVQEAHEPRPGEPKRIGPPLDGAVRITFLLFSGARMDLTFCASCAESLTPQQYTDIWRKILRSWQREVQENPNERTKIWLARQFSSGLLCEIGRLKWKDLVHAG